MVRLEGSEGRCVGLFFVFFGVVVLDVVEGAVIVVGLCGFSACE